MRSTARASAGPSTGAKSAQPAAIAQALFKALWTGDLLISASARIARHRQGTPMKDGAGASERLVCPPWCARARVQLVKAVCKALVASASVTELDAIEAELASPQVLVAVHAVVTGWICWAFEAAHYFEADSWRAAHPYVSRLFPPVVRVRELWGEEAWKTVVALRIGLAHRVAHGDRALAAELVALDPAWLRVSPVGNAVGPELAQAVNNARRESLGHLKTLFGISRAPGHPRSDDRGLFLRVAFVEWRHLFPDDESFFGAALAFLNERCSLENFVKRELRGGGARKADAKLAPYATSITPMVRTRQPLHETVIEKLLSRVSPIAGSVGELLLCSNRGQKPKELKTR